MAIIRCARDCKVDCNLVAAIVAVLCLLSVTVFSSLNAKACPNRDVYLSQLKNCSRQQRCLEDWCTMESNWTDKPDRCKELDFSKLGFDPAYNKRLLTDSFPDDPLSAGMGLTGVSLLILTGLVQAISQIANCIEPGSAWDRRRELDAKQQQTIESERRDKKKRTKKRLVSFCMAFSAWASWGASTAVLLVISVQTMRDWGMYNCTCPLWIAVAVMSPVAAILFAVVVMKSSSLMDRFESSRKLPPRMYIGSKPEEDEECGKPAHQNPMMPPSQWSSFRGSEVAREERYADSAEGGRGQRQGQQSPYPQGGSGSGKQRSYSRPPSGGLGGQQSPYRAATSSGQQSPYRTAPSSRPGTPAAAASPKTNWGAAARSEDEGMESVGGGGGAGVQPSRVDSRKSANNGGTSPLKVLNGQASTASLQGLAEGGGGLRPSSAPSPARGKFSVARSHDGPVRWSANDPPPPPPPPRSPQRGATAAQIAAGGSTGISGGVASTGSIGSGMSDMSVRSSSSDFSVEDLRKATNDFSPSKILGKGGFGCVYKAVLEDGTTVAVKRLHRDSTTTSAVVGLQNKGSQGAREFKAEVSIIGRVHHRHLVQLIGYAITESEQLLVYEYMPNGSLYDHLHDRQKNKTVLDWPTRVKIAVGAAKGLAYLHEGCNPKVVHRDVKAHNILLDAEFQAKVSDFGLARLLGDEVTHITTRVMGTFGYLAPEYALSGQLTERSDVYSFGVVLLELVTGRRPVDQTRGGEKRSLVEWAWQMGGTDPAEIADPDLEGDFDKDELSRMWATGVLAVNHLAQDRPTMDQVMRMVKGEGDPLTADGPGSGGGSSSRRHKPTMRWFSGWISSPTNSKAGVGDAPPSSSKNGSLSQQGSKSGRASGEAGLRKRGIGGTGGNETSRVGGEDGSETKSATDRWRKGKPLARSGSQRREERGAERGEDEDREEYEDEEGEDEESSRVARVLSKTSETDWGSFSGPVSSTSKPLGSVEEARAGPPLKEVLKEEAVRGVERQRGKPPGECSPTRSPPSPMTRVRAEGQIPRRSPSETARPREGGASIESPLQARRPTAAGAASRSARGVMEGLDFGNANQEERFYRGR